MNIIPYREQKNPALVGGPDVFLKIDFNDRYIRNITKEFGKLEENNKKLLELLQSFNKHIVDVAASRQQYTVFLDGEEEVLSFASLSTGERLLAACFMAHTIKQKITVCYELAELDFEKYKLFFRLFHNSSYVDIIQPADYLEDLIEAFYKKAQEGEFNDILPHIILD